MPKILTPTGWRMVTIPHAPHVRGFKLFSEELNATQVDDVRSWPRDPKAVRATHHYFGINLDTKDHQLEDTQDKSEVHKEVEKHLNQPIHVNDYRSGKIKDKYNRDVRLGSALQKTKASPQLINKFANDSTRQGTKFSGLHVHVTRSPEGVAGQASGNQSWASTSCKNFVDGIERGYLKHEVKHGTVVSYLKDHTGKELARATMQPHLNKEGRTAYKVTSHYGIDHAGFKDHANKVAADLSHPTGDKSGLYKMHPKVHNDSYDNDDIGDDIGKVDTMLHPHIDHAGIHKIINDAENTDLVKLAVRHPKATAEHISAGLKNVHLAIREAAVRHPKATAEHISTGLQDNKWHVREAALEHPNATAEHISTGLKDGEGSVRVAALRHPNATAEHISTGLKDKDGYVRRAASEHPNATAEHISAGMKDKEWPVRTAAIRHPNATAEHINAGMNDEEWSVRQSAVGHPKANAGHISAGMNDKHPDVRGAAVSHPKATADHISAGLKDENGYVRAAAMRHPKATAEHISAGLKDNHLMVRTAAVEHPKATAEHISTGLKDEDKYVRAAAMRHPNATAEHISIGLKDENEYVREATKRRNR